MKKKILIFSTHSPNSKLSASALEKMKYLENEADSLYFLTKNKTFKKTAETVERKSKIDIPVVGIDNTKLLEHFHANVPTKVLKNWKEIYDDIDVDFLKDFDKIYIFSGLSASGHALSRQQVHKWKDKFPDIRIPPKFMSISMIFYFWLCILKLHNKYRIPLTEMLQDTCELSLNLLPDEYRQNDIYDLRFCYTDTAYEIYREDSCQYYLNKTVGQINEEKIYDFTFGYTVLTNHRHKVIDKYLKTVYNTFNKQKINIFCKDKKSEINTFIPREEYLDYISKSRFTLVIPAYDDKQLSTLRIKESLSYGCIPLFSKDSNVEVLHESFSGAIKIINEHLYIEDFEDMSDTLYFQLLEQLRNIFLEVKYLP